MDAPWQRHRHGLATGWSHIGRLPRRELAWAQLWCRRLGTFLRGMWPSLPPRLPGAKSGTRQPQEGCCGQGCPSPPLPRDPVAPSLCAGCRHPACALGLSRVPRAVPCPGLCRVPRAVPRAKGCAVPQAPRRHAGSYLCPWGPSCRAGGGGLGGLRRQPARPCWARAGLGCCSWRRAASACLLLRQPCQARGGTCPHRALAKVRQRPGTIQQWPMRGTTGLLCPAMRHVGATETGSPAGTCPAPHGLVGAYAGHVSSSSTRSLRAAPTPDGSCSLPCWHCGHHHDLSQGPTHPMPVGAAWDPLGWLGRVLRGQLWSPAGSVVVHCGWARQRPRCHTGMVPFIS